MGPELLYQIIYTALVIGGAVIITRIISRLLRRFTEKANIDAHASRPIIRLANVIVYIVALIILLGVWGLKGELTGILAGAGIAGIVIGFATKDMLSDLLAGIMLFFDRPFKIGHVINMGELWGTVQDIGLRSTKVKTFDGKFVTIPNRKVAESVVTNVSVYEGRRLELEVGVSYDTDLGKARGALERAVRKMEKAGKIKEEPKTKILLEGFGDSSIKFKLLFWYNPEYTREHSLWFSEVRGDLVEAIKREFDKSGITIPFPQRDVHLYRPRKKR